MSALNLRIEDKIAILEFDEPDSKVNVLNTETMKEFAGMIDELAGKAERGLKGLIITSKKDGIFIAGADIKEIEHIKSSDEAMKKAENGKQVLMNLKNLNLITVAAINGACLGGGLELALASKYRVATFSEKVRIGLPEVNLGVIPGFGGTVRLPRLIGLAAALNLILSGRMISGKDALKCGLIDRLFPETRLLEETIDFTNNIIEGREEVKPRQKKKLFQTFLEETPPGRAILFSQARKNVLRVTKGFYPAPVKALEVIMRTLGRENEKSFYAESEAFSELAVTDVSKNLIKVFYLTEEFKKFPWVDSAIKPAEINKCAVLGAGVMGGGIAQLAAFRDIPVRVKDINQDAVKKALKTAHDLFEDAVRKRKLKKHEALYKFGLISPTVTYKGFETADIVIEAVVESLNVKQAVFKEVEGLTLRKTIIASNTSSLPITKLSETIEAPEMAVGLHFFNPVHKMPLVEVIKSARTSDETLATTIAFARRLGKTVIVVKDVPGFLINRILLSYLNEAGFLAEEGMGIEHIDRIVRGFGMPMGPIELIDEVGIDVGYKVAKVLEESYGARMRVCSLLEKVKEKGILGKKSKRGFYIYKGKKKKEANPDLYGLIKPSAKSPFSDDITLKRMIYIMINEGARCLEEKVADRPKTIDVGMIMGCGFPPFRAGLLRYADSVGVRAIARDLESFEREFKRECFRPCDYLVRKSEKDEGFYDNPAPPPHQL